MDYENTVPAKPARKKPFILFSIIQWIVTGFFGFVTLGLLSEIRKLDVPAAPVTFFWITIAIIIVMAVVHVPPVFFRLPWKAKIAAYVGVFGAFIMFGVCLDQMQTAFEATPAGAKQAAIRHKEEAKAAAEQAERDATKRSLAEMDALGKQLQDYNDKAERCFTSWGHQLPALTDAVKNGLHNPHAFEHVKTVLTVADADSNNVEMTFRAENGFGALRTARVKAQLVADGCVVQNIREPEIE